MAKSRQAGFTLIELILVFAVSGLLLVIAFIGQRSLRSQAQFDGSIDKLASTVAQARNEATAGVNIAGPNGDGSDNVPGCSVGGTQANIFAGVSWTADNSTTTNAVFTVDYYVAQVDKGTDPLGQVTGTACRFDSRTVSMPTDLQVDIANGVSQQRGGRVLFVRTDTGRLVVCQLTNLTDAVEPSFANGACTAPAVAVPAGWQLDVNDADGHTSQVLIDPGGLAKRQN
jgi:prepilin-type N-terminal cleavage/methylation domain-containing protein